MSRRSEFFAPLLVTALFSAAAPVVYQLFWTDSTAAAQTRRTDLYIIESPMGSWVADDKPSVHLNGTVSFRDAESGDELTIDSGGVVIRPNSPNQF